MNYDDPKPPLPFPYPKPEPKPIPAAITALMQGRVTPEQIAALRVEHNRVHSVPLGNDAGLYLKSQSWQFYGRAVTGLTYEQAQEWLGRLKAMPTATPVRRVTFVR